jgi:hypothetical protein
LLDQVLLLGCRVAVYGRQVPDVDGVRCIIGFPDKMVARRPFNEKKKRPLALRESPVGP